MTRQKPGSSRLAEERTADEATRLTSGPSDVPRLARLVADGSMPFPTGLSVADVNRLAEEVVRIRRQRLLKFIARAIADDILREAGP